MTSYQRRCDVMTSHRRSDVILTSCARWDSRVVEIHVLYFTMSDNLAFVKTTKPMKVLAEFFTISQLGIKHTFWQWEWALFRPQIKHRTLYRPSRMCKQVPDHCFLLTNEPHHEKTSYVVSEQVRHKPSCTSTKDGKRLEIFEL